MKLFPIIYLMFLFFNLGKENHELSKTNIRYNKHIISKNFWKARSLSCLYYFWTTPKKIASDEYKNWFNKVLCGILIINKVSLSTKRCIKRFSD
jgi:hypothetical protein